MRLKRKIFLIPGGLFLAFIILTFMVDKGLAVGLFVLFISSAATLLLLYKRRELSRLFLLLIIIAFLIHFFALLFIHYTHFQPFGSGDYVEYDKEAKIISQRFNAGIFSLKEIYYHRYSLFVGLIYYLTLPEMIIGELVNLWLVTFSIIFVFLIVKEIGGSEKQAFAAGLVVTFYPSLLFYGSFLLKDPLVVFACLLDLLLTIKLIKKFSWKLFLVFYIALGIIVGLRFYIRFAMLITFVLSWFALSELKLKTKIIYIIIILPLFGFLFYIYDYGYFGIDIFKEYFYPEKINYYRNFIYNEPGVSNGSTIKFRNYLDSFISMILGPFPWQIKYFRQLVALFETIPWYFLLFFIIKGAIKMLKQNKNKMVIPILMFSLIIFAVLGIFVSNFGAIIRVRIPAFLSLICLLPFGFSFESKFFKNISNATFQILRRRFNILYT